MPTLDRERSTLQSKILEDLDSLTEQARSNPPIDELVSDGELDGDDDSFQADALGSKTGRDSFVENATAFIECLMTLIPALERIGRPRLGIRRIHGQQESLAFYVTGPARIYVRQILDRFPNAATRLAERLGEANWQRHVEIRKRMDEGLDDTVFKPENVIVPKSKFHDSGLGTSAPANSNYAMSIISQTSFASSLAEKEQGTLRVPPTPLEVAAGMPFQCSICCQVVHNIQNRRDWK